MDIVIDFRRQVIPKDSARTGAERVVGSLKDYSTDPRVSLLHIIRRLFELGPREKWKYLLLNRYEVLARSVASFAEIVAGMLIWCEAKFKNIFVELKPYNNVPECEPKYAAPWTKVAYWPK